MTSNGRFHSKPNGYCLLPSRGRLHTVIGGPFDAYQGGYGVCLERSSVCARKADLTLDIPDFGVPAQDEFEAAIERIIEQMVSTPSLPVYIGCRGGIGRTGMVIAALARVVLGDAIDPIRWVRCNYLQGAVETDAQARLVRSFDPTRARSIAEPPLDTVVTTPIESLKPGILRRLRTLFSLS